MPLEQVTVMPLQVPSAVGVPERTPVELPRPRPVGSVPAVSVQVRVPGLPEALNVRSQQ